MFLLHTHIEILKTNRIDPPRLERAKRYACTNEQAAYYDRDSPSYPYKSHGQWLKAAYGCGGCFIVLLFNGVPSLLQNPIYVNRFIAAYITASSPICSREPPNR